MGQKYEYVEQPQHYQGTGMTVMEVIRAFKLDFACGNVIKYVLRAGRKPDEDKIRELEKALWYLQDEINHQRASLAEDNADAKPETPAESLTAMGRRESAGEWGAVRVPEPELRDAEPAVEVADVMHFTNVSHFPPSTRASELTAFIKAHLEAQLDDKDDH